MKRLATTMLVLLLSLSVTASDWTGPDKLKHFQYSTAIGFGSMYVLGITDYDGPRTLTASAVCASVGVAKELHDIGGTGFDTKDLAYDAVGCLLGVYTADYMFHVDAQDDYVGIQFQTKF